MKVNTTILILVLLITQSCGNYLNKKESRNNLPTTEIPKILTHNQEVVVYFETLDEAIAEYLILIKKLEQTSVDTKKSGDSLSFSNAMTMLKDVSISTIKIAELVEEMDKLEKESNVLKENLSVGELEEFVKVYANTIKRFHELSEQ